MLASAFVTVDGTSLFTVGSGMSVIIMVITKLFMITICIPTHVIIIAIVADIDCESTVITSIDMIVVVVVALIVTVTNFQGSPNYCTLSFYKINAKEHSIFFPF